MTIGYNGPAGDDLEFYVAESLALMVRAPERSVC